MVRGSVRTDSPRPSVPGRRLAQLRLSVPGGVPQRECDVVTAQRNRLPSCPSSRPVAGPYPTEGHHERSALADGRRAAGAEGANVGERFGVEVPAGNDLKGKPGVLT